MTWINKLYYGDCLTIMQDLPLNSVDLIYLDPPFNSNRAYNAIYRDETGRPLPIQVEAFCDAWELTEERERAIRTMPLLMRDSNIDDDTVEFWRLWMNALRNTNPRLLAYLSYMAERLLVMYRLMKPTASLYLHCDTTASHYLKALLDALFGHDNFRNEIVWRRVEGGKSDAGQYGRSSDRLLFYTRSSSFYFDPPRLPDHDKEVVDKWYNNEDEIGRYTKHKLTASGKRNGDSGQPWRDKIPTGHWVVPHILRDRYEFKTKRKLIGSVRERLDILADNGYIEFSGKGLPFFRKYLHEANPPRVHDIWIDEAVKPMSRNAKERMGYDTQKPLALLKRVISVSSKQGDLILDPFCGCATTLEAAQHLGRRWIGIDIAIHAIKRVAQVRLVDRCGLQEDRDFVVEGVPRTLEGAQDLWERDKYQFQKWAVEQIDGFATLKRSADGGVDGRIYFDMPGKRDLQSMVLEVKGGKHVNIQALRALRGVLDAEDAQMAGLIIMEPLGDRQQKNFVKFMAQAGDLEINGFPYPRMQILSVKEILEEGKRFRLPNIAGRHELKPRLIPVQPGA